jgi:hypothetical protein
MLRLLLSSVCLLLLACEDTQPTSESGSPSHRVTGTAKDMMQQTSEPSFPQLAPAPDEEERVFPDALLIGTLIQEGGCLRVAPSEGGPSYLIVWPPQVTFEAQGGRLKVIDSENRSAASEGEKITLGGGEIDSSAQILRDLQQPIPQNCAGPLWLASGLVSSR